MVVKSLLGHCIQRVANILKSMLQFLSVTQFSVCGSSLIVWKWSSRKDFDKLKLFQGFDNSSIYCAGMGFRSPNLLYHKLFNLFVLSLGPPVYLSLARYVSNTVPKASYSKYSFMSTHKVFSGHSSCSPVYNLAHQAFTSQAKELLVGGLKGNTKFSFALPPLSHLPVVQNMTSCTCSRHDSSENGA